MDTVAPRDVSPLRPAPSSWIDAPSIPIDFDGPTLPFPGFCPSSGPETPILAHLHAITRAAPHAIAVQDGTRGVSFQDLLSTAAALAGAIAARVPAGVPVGIRLPDGVGWPIAQLACLIAGVPSVGIDPASPPERLRALMDVGNLAALVTDTPIAHLPCIPPDASGPACSGPSRAIPQDAAAFIVFTSGSTGQPKGIVHSQRSVLHRAGLLVNSGHLRPSDAYLSLNMAATVGALLNTIAAWISGATLHRVAGASGPLGLGRVLHHIRTHGVTAMIGVPAIYRALTRLSAARDALSSVRLVSSNGDALLTADLAQMRAVLPPDCHIQMIYGATESQAGLRFVPATEAGTTPQVPAGQPVPGTQFAILREDGSPVAPGEAGALHIRSRYTAIGEWRDGGCVPGRLPFDGDPHAGWRAYAMGDVVRQREDGVLVVIGREDRQLKINGVRIEPIEIEAVLRGDAEVREAIVLPVATAIGTDLVAFVAAPEAASAEDLHARLTQHLAARLTASMRPRRLHVLPALPMLSGNKVDAVALRAHDRAAAG